VKENCPHCKVHRGHKAGCPALAEEIANTTKGIFKDQPRAADPEKYSVENYRKFLRAKCNLPADFGVPIDPGEIHPWLKPHQKAAVEWAVRGGRRALFESFGLGKTVQQLEILRLILKATKGRWDTSKQDQPILINRALIVAPLGVKQEFTRDARKIDIDLKFIRRIE